jgi:hypothetical protein
MARVCQVSVAGIVALALAACGGETSDPASTGGAAGSGGGQQEAGADRDSGSGQQEAGADGDMDSGACEHPSPIDKIGCVETPSRPSLMVNMGSVKNTSYACQADEVDSVVRIRACVSLPANPCTADAGGAYCGVVEIATSELAKTPDNSIFTLDGLSTFTFRSPLDDKVDPANVTYKPIVGLTTKVSRVWMEKQCFCTPLPPLTATQELSGDLRISSAAGGRLKGQLTLAAAGHVPPTNTMDERIELDAYFDVPVTPSVPPDR